MNDVKVALRQLRNNPGFTAAAVLTLALGIGANTAIFSVINAVVLKPLPFLDPERIVMLWADNPGLNVGLHELPPAPPDLLDWRRQAVSFDQIAAFRTAPADLAAQGEPERVGGVQVTANFFALLGVEPVLGRVFSPEEEQLGKDKVVILSHRLWQRRFDGQKAIIGQSITVNHERVIVIGVMPPGFNFPQGAEMPTGYALMAQTDLWRPYADKAEYWSNDDLRELIAMGRLRRGVGLAQAQAEMTRLGQEEAKVYPKTHTGWTIFLRPLSLQVAGSTRPVLFLLLAAVALVLLIACANVANLLLSRSASRRKEMAVRAALGAGRGRIARQLLTESLLLAGAGGMVGLALGIWALQLILPLTPASIPRLGEASLDGTVLVFNLGLSLATGVLFGLAPAWHSSRMDLAASLNAESRSHAAAGWHRTQGWLIGVEVALAVILLLGAGLMLQSFWQLQSVHLGFNPQRVATFDVALNGPRYGDPARQRQFYREARARLATIPGVRGAAAISNLPFGGVENLSFFHLEGGAEAVPGQEPFAENRKVTPGYFVTMGIPLLQGRDFTDSDVPSGPNVIVINETIARTFFAGRNPVGKRLKFGREWAEQKPWLTIIGVVSDVRTYALDTKPRPQIYTTVEQNTDDAMTYVVRAEAIPADALEQAVHREMKALDPTLPLANFKTMQTLVANAIARPRFSSFLVGLFALTAVLLTVVGLYGVVAYATALRRREIAIRQALGARRWDVLRMVMRQGMTLVVCGIAAGLAGALALTRVLRSLLFGVSPTDPFTFILIPLLLGGLSLVACWVPAWRGSGVPPMEALRQE